MRDDTTLTLDTRSEASTLLPALCDFTFLAFLDQWNSILEETEQAQKYLQTPGLTLDRSLTKLRALETFLSTERSALIEKAVSFDTQKCEQLGIETEKCIRRKKKLPGEAASDSGSSLKKEVRRSMFESVDRFHQEIKTRFEDMNTICDTFAIVQSEMLMNGSDQQLEIAAEKLNSTYDEFGKQDVLVEVKRFRRHICAAQVEVEIAASWSAKEVLQFIVEYDFNESLPNICQFLQYFLSVCVSVATCERSFSKLHSIKNYLRSTMLQERLTSLAILSIEKSSEQY